MPPDLKLAEARRAFRTEGGEAGEELVEAQLHLAALDPGMLAEQPLDLLRSQRARRLVVHPRLGEQRRDGLFQARPQIGHVLVAVFCCVVEKGLDPGGGQPPAIAQIVLQLS